MDLSTVVRQRRPWPILLAGVLLVGGVGLGPLDSSLAAFTSADQPQLVATVERLDPPPNVTCSNGLLACTAGLVARPQLTWDMTPDAYATGYQVWRSTTNGGGYVLAATAAGRATTTWTDNGAMSALTTYYYVVRSVSPAWTSAYSNQVTVTIVLGG